MVLYTNCTYEGPVPVKNFPNTQPILLSVHVVISCFLINAMISYFLINAMMLFSYQCNDKSLSATNSAVFTLSISVLITPQAFGQAFQYKLIRLRRLSLTKQSADKHTQSPQSSQRNLIVRTQSAKIDKTKKKNDSTKKK